MEQEKSWTGSADSERDFQLLSCYFQLLDLTTELFGAIPTACFWLFTLNK